MLLCTRVSAAGCWYHRLASPALLQRPRLQPRPSPARAASSGQLDSTDYLSALYTRLSSRPRYQFLAPLPPASTTDTEQDQALHSGPEFKEFLKIIAGSDNGVEESDLLGIQKQLSERFRDWSRGSQLRVGFLLHIDKRIDSGDYLSRLIHFMGAELRPFDASTDELTAFLLLVYFKRDLNVEALSEVLDLSILQTALAGKIDRQEMTAEEVCAACLGLKRIQDFKINCSQLRKSLYLQLANFYPQGDQLDDFFVVTVMTTLTKGNMVFMDDVSMVQQVVARLERAVAGLRLDTAVKILTFPLTLGFRNHEVEAAVLDRVEVSLASLQTWDLLQVCNYISKNQTLDRPGLQQVICEFLEQKMVETRDDLINIIECFHYLSHVGVYSQQFNTTMFSAVNSLPASQFSKGCNWSELTERICLAMLEQLGAGQVEEMDMRHERNSSKTISVFTRIPAFISTSCSVDTEMEVGMEREREDFLLRSQHRQLPMELFVPQMETRQLDHRSRQMINCYRALVHFMGGEQFVGVTRVLPHFTEPDLVFGNIGGICMTVPGQLAGREVAPGPILPPPGDWWVMVMGTRKSHDRAGNLVGQEAAKLRQLKKLGYSAIVIPYFELNSNTVAKSIAKHLKTENVSLPNLDDGKRSKSRKF